MKVKELIEELQRYENIYPDSEISVLIQGGRLIDIRAGFGSMDKGEFFLQTEQLLNEA